MIGPTPLDPGWYPARRLLVVPLSVLLLLVAGCGGGGAGGQRRPGSVLWLTSESAPVSPETMDALARQGVGEVFLQAVELAWSGGRPELRSDFESVVVPRAPVTLVVRGEPPPQEVEDLAAGLAGELTALELEVERRGGLPAGFHLHLAIPGEAALEPLARLTRELGYGLGPKRPLSVTLPRRLMGTEGARSLARAAGALVVFLYGQGPGEADEPEAWDLQAVRNRLELLEGLETDYLVGVITLGRLARKDASGRTLEATTRGSVRRLLDHRALEDTLGSALKAVDGRIYEFRARGATRAGPWRLKAGERVQVTLLGGSHLRRLRRMLSSPGWEHLLGQAWYRPPGPEEKLAVLPSVLADALAETPSPSQIEVRKAVESRDHRLAIRLRVTNAGSESTEIARVGDNFVELRSRRGRFLQVDPGDFGRYDLIDSASGRRSLRADTVRLFSAYLAAGETVESGELLLTGGEEDDLMVRGSFLLPDGSSAMVVEMESVEKRGESEADEARTAGGAARP